LSTVYQRNELSREIKEKTGESNRRPTKNLGVYDPLRPSLRISAAYGITVWEWLEVSCTRYHCSSNALSSNALSSFKL